MASLRKLIIQLEQAMAPTRKLKHGDMDAPKKKSSAPAHHTPDLAKRDNAQTQAPTRKVAPKALPKSGKSTAGVGQHEPAKKLKPGEKMVFGRVVKSR